MDPLRPSDEYEHGNPEKCHTLPRSCPTTCHKAEDLKLDPHLPEKSFNKVLTSKQKINKEREGLNNVTNHLNSHLQSTQPN